MKINHDDNNYYYDFFDYKEETLSNILRNKDNKILKKEVFNDPIYGYIYFDYSFLKELINTEVFQRLRRIRQLSCVNIVFGSSEHSRFMHSLGVYELSRRFLENNHELFKEERIFGTYEKLLLMTAALLHDIGHGFYSHIFENIFPNINHVEMSAKIIQNNVEITSILNKIENERFQKDLADIISKKSKNYKFKIIEEILSSQLDFDRLDYLKRDAFFTGVSYGHIETDRLIRNISIEQNNQKKLQIVHKYSGIKSIENYIISRYHMYEQVYNHRKIIGYSVIIEKIFERIFDLIEKKYDFNFGNILNHLKTIPKDIYSKEVNINNYLKLDDFYANSLIIHLQEENDEILSNLCKDFLNRKIWNFLDYNSEKDDNFLHENKIEEKEKNYNYYFFLDDPKKSHFIAYQENQDTKNQDTKCISIRSADNQIKHLSEESFIIKCFLDEQKNKQNKKIFYRNDEIKKFLNKKIMIKSKINNEK
ncbi:HD domain-containing protein [Candidatus Phytoplasma pini]|uniref:HD superfamily phosphohydrolase n=1 Tax=Candidatus Phytoplasma pini TaxID=267362 RepID=A0A559KJ12_9MOLU|nr:HD domain-containing protein [Candidatus Phytoplasma pini]TVY12121.1 HD superfamily phosphohydrolase [Candidatus Phytoplasma pini]TVY12124.1 HD superfamily phosphohydrolase [Candidatus Phytoplasma pini]